MLNTCLTVRRGQANSHKNRGWEDFTDEIVRILLTRKEQNNGDGNNGIVFLLWGNPAAKKAKSVIKTNNSSSNHDNTVVIITTSHPSPLGATKTKTPFLTSNCFSRVNDALIEMGQEPIDWYQR
jgi:uracil-DNA glycosylase